MVTIEDLAKEIEQIKKRNRRVELDKSWETSFFRKVLLVFFTYLSIGLYMYVIKIEKPWLNAVIPSVGFFLSTLTLPLFKDYWIKKNK
ncbi:MAG: hypothetical protein UR89_C0043G0004 [Candidatus Roizmanbacteria bacterium GW2011_GWA2_35_8]|uniref:2TM domain-containing protein n=1 Tax=Candidatus Roizmanbacteria bacterium GW2011_GWA2_35_8 TaxID=1618479 RepID=A0A0G0CV83_9BACT|nr:MAG: hypothetical protein UR89_C0043G0004 [Candidatus Roizmanbacteria bacterium GW2011_GWA2_35_8]